jgi:hypothetical protein
MVPVCIIVERIKDVVVCERLFKVCAIATNADNLSVVCILQRKALKKSELFSNRRVFPQISPEKNVAHLLIVAQ